MAVKYSDNKLDTIPTQTLSFYNFLGVDYFHSRQDVANYRAVEMSNLIHRNGINQKRFGYKQVNHFEEYRNGAFHSLKINGVWTLKTNIQDTNGNLITKTVIHAGTNFYVIDGSDLSGTAIPLTIKQYNLASGTTSPIGSTTSNKIRNEMSYGITRGNRLYILCGLYLVFGSWELDNQDNPIFELRMVEDNVDTYIPTTTINITPLSDNNQIARESFDEPNLLSNYRINQLKFDVYNKEYDDISIYENDTGLTAYWKRNIKFDKNIANATITFSIDEIVLSIPIDELPTYELTAMPATEETGNYRKFLKDHGLSEEEINKLDTKKIYCMTTRTNGDYKYLIIGSYIAGVNYYFYTFDFAAYIIDSKYESTTYYLDAPIKSSGKVLLNKQSLALNDDYYLDTNEPNKIILKPSACNYATSISELTFQVDYGADNPADTINGCKFGCIYAYNELNQFFVSGNPNYPNVDWHSSDRYYNATQEFSQTDYEDLTYFSSESYYNLGSANNAIKGYALLQDNVLAVFKEYNKDESMMWIRKPAIKTITLNGIDYAKIYYSHSPTAITEGALNYHTIEKMYNDNLFLSSNGIYKVQLSENLQSDVRIAVERSSIVNNRLTKEDLANATAIVHDNRYYLATPNGKVYIADSRFRNQVSGELPDTISYEFWVWDNVPVRIWFENNGVLGFGTEDGRICLFNIEESNQEAFQDVVYKYYGASLSVDGDELIVNEEANVKEGDILSFVEPIKTPVFDDTLTENTTVFEASVVEWQKFVEPSLDKKVYIEEEGQTAREGYLRSPDLFTYTYCFTASLDDDPSIAGNRLSISAGAVLIYRYTDRDYTVSDVTHLYENNTHITKIQVESNYFDSVQEKYDPEVFLEDSSISFKLITKTPVSCFWLTPSVDMGAPNINKSIYKTTLVPEHNIDSIINVEFTTLREKKNITLDGANVLDFNYFNFNAITFMASLHELAYNSRKLIRNVNFIMYRFYSDNEYNFAIKEFRVEYKLLRAWKGAH